MEEAVNDELRGLYNEAIEKQKLGNYFEAGRSIGIMTNTLCPG
jgi:hypothetical protein